MFAGSGIMVQVCLEAQIEPHGELLCVFTREEVPIAMRNADVLFLHAVVYPF